MAFKKESDRASYLQQLVTEFQDTTSDDVRHQVLANLANFSYDPANFETLRRLGIIELFLDQLDNDDDDLMEFAIGGLCNLSPDPQFKTGIVRRNGIQPILKCLSSTNEETVLSAITTLMSLIDYESVHVITSIPVVECMMRFSQSNNPRLSNLSQIFLQDCCTPDKIEQARLLQSNRR